MDTLDPSTPILARADDADVQNSVATYFYACTEVTPTCPVQATTLGYYPNRGINIFFAIAFGLAGIITLALGVWKKTWSYMAFITAGCALEFAGGFQDPAGVGNGITQM